MALSFLDIGYGLFMFFHLAALFLICVTTLVISKELMDIAETFTAIAVASPFLNLMA